MEKKDLEQFFKEKFTDFQETPDEKVWNAIEASLDRKKKRRAIPIWWQLGGVAALFALLLYIVNPLGRESGQDSQSVTETEQNDFQNEDRTNPVDSEDSIDFNQNDSQLELTDTKSDSDGNENQIRGTVTTPSAQNYAKTDNANKEFGSTSTEVASNQKATDLDPITSENQEQPQNVLEAEEAIASVGIKENNETEIGLKKKAENKGGQNVVTGEEEVVAENKEDGKKSIFEAIEEKETEEKALAEGKKGRWSVGPSVAPVYFNSFGEGSPVHSNFSSNSKSGNVNLSYGLTVAYDLGKRLTVRSGIHRVDFGYDTNDIVFSSSLNSSTTEEIDNINFAQSSRNLVVESKINAPVDNTIAADFIARAPEFEGRMVQQMEYLEVPLELNYALIDKKIGVNLIGGVSSLFLVDNSVSLESDGLVTEVGEANNVNSMNFSTNVGVGFDYEFSPKMQVRLEPVFKYQLNTFSDAAGNFRPFSVGIYSGLSFKF